MAGAAGSDCNLLSVPPATTNRVEGTASVIQDEVYCAWLHRLRFAALLLCDLLKCRPWSKTSCQDDEASRARSVRARA